MSGARIIRFPPPADAGEVMFSVGPRVAALLVTLAAHERVTVGELIGRMTIDKAKALGLKTLARAIEDRA